jgi:hypothetical protein
MNLEKIIQYVRHARAELAKDALAPEDDAMPPMVVFGREGKTLATVFCKRVNRDDGLEVANIGIRGWGADEIALVCDAHTRPVNPKNEDGEYEFPERGSMQKDCEACNGQHADGVVDIMMVMRMTRDEDTSVRCLPYQVDYDAGEICWKDELPELAKVSDDDKTSFSGAIPDAIRQMFNREPLEISQLNVEEHLSGDDPIGRILGRLIKQTANPDQARREFVDEIVSSMIPDRVPCTVVMTREGKEPL